MAQLPLTSLTPESNPYPSDVPSTIQEIGILLYAFLLEQAQILREQHQRNQAGDTTFHWELLTKLDSKPVYNLGSLGRFYHPTYGVIHARYCQFRGLSGSPTAGTPVGILVKPSVGHWQVTDQFLSSKPSMLVGLAAAYEPLVEGAYGWVIVAGINLHTCYVDDEIPLELGGSLVWHGTGVLSQALGSPLGILATDKYESSLGGKYEIAPAGIVVSGGVNSLSSLQRWFQAENQSTQDSIAALADAVNLAADLDSLQSYANQLQELAQIVETLTTGLTVEESRRRTDDDSQVRRIEALENQTYQTLFDSLTVKCDELAAKFAALADSNEVGHGEIWTRLNEVAVAVSSLPGIVESLSNTTVSLAAQFNELLASKVAFTPAVAAVNVQAALEELDSEKVPKITSVDNTLARFDGVAGLIQGSATTLSDAGDLGLQGHLTLANAKYAYGRRASGATTRLLGLNASDTVYLGSIDVALTTILNLAAGALSIYGVATFISTPKVPDAAFTAGWDGSVEVPTKNAVYDRVAPFGVPGVLTHSTDANLTLIPGTSKRHVRLTGTLTADRTLTLSTSGVLDGIAFRITRTGAGAFNWNIGTGPLKVLAANSWCEVAYDSAAAAWYLVASGTL